MTYRITNHEIELLLSFYRDIKKYNDLLEKEIRDAHYGVDSQIYAAFKLNRVSESTKISYIRDYCSMVKKAMKAWENSKNDKEYRAYRVIELMFLGKHDYTRAAITKRLGFIPQNLYRYFDKGLEIFKRYMTKQFTKFHYTQSNSPSIIVEESYHFEYDRNLELMFYIVSNVARLSREYFSGSKSSNVSDTKIHDINKKAKELKEVS